MKKIASLVLISTLTFSAASQAEGGWFDSIKGMLGFGESAEEVVAEAAPSMTGMISALSENLGVSSEQAQGGLGSLMNYVKGNVSSDKFSALSSSLPGIDQVLNAVPEVKNIAGEGGVAALLNKAAEYNEQLKSLNTLKQQFEALGLSPDMISGFVTQAQAYLDTPLGQEAKKIFTDSLTNFI